MTEIFAIVEGQTEETFVKSMLSEPFGGRGIAFKARRAGYSRRQGGNRPWGVIVDDISRTLKERNDRFCTLMYDYYALPHDWPGRVDADAKPKHERASHIQAALFDDFKEKFPNLAYRFIPYIQMHEFEALLFSDAEQLAANLAAHAERPRAVRQEIEDILSEFEQYPEMINDRPDFAPSKRILSINKSYNKPLRGRAIAEQIGLPKIRAKCHNFNAWLSKLENLGTNATP